MTGLLETVEPLSRVRAVIAERMQASLRDTAQLTCVVEVDFGRMLALRAEHGERFRQRHGCGLGALAVTARGVCAVLPNHRTLNARINTAARTATFYEGVNLGIAVDTPAGLLVPNIKRAHGLSVAGVAQAISELADRARRRKLTLEDLEGGTFTITNTGSRGSLLDTPILNHPEVGILALGRLERRPVAVGTGAEEHVEIRDMSYVCLTYDHRLVDGAEAARFLGDLKQWLEGTDLTADLDLD